jgi:rhodanese-related sulfurtransferase
MLQKLITAAFVLLFITSNAQYKNDNVLFKTVDPSDLCAALLKSKGYLLLDVRSKGEYSDTSAFGINMGHLKDAVNINVRELGNRLSEINNYKDKPVFVYCSHSQRSRRASKMLADSGFSNIYNINGGMTALYFTNVNEKECLKSMIITSNQYKIVSPTYVCNRLSAKSNDVYLLDVRSDSAYRHISTDDKENAYGYLKGSVNIPFAVLGEKVSSIPKDKEIIIADLYGHDAAEAAKLLLANGFSRVSTLIEGIDHWLDEEDNQLSCKNSLYVSPVNYKILSGEEINVYTKAHPAALMLDIRTNDEFANKAKENYKNVGHINGATHIPLDELSNRMNEIENYKNEEVLVYAFSNNTIAYTAAKKLSDAGFKKISVLAGGIFGIRWTAANVKGKASLKDLVVDVPEENW